MITYLQGDATQPIGDGMKIIAHVCNDRGGWGRGFVLALSRKWPEPERAYRQWFGKPTFRLGAAQIVQVDGYIHVANMVAQSGYGPGNRNRHQTAEMNSTPPIRYAALEECLQEVGNWARNNQATVHMPRIGTGLGGGRWEEVEPILNSALADLDVFVYDL